MEAHEDLQRTIAGADVVISMLSDGSATKKVISKLENKVLSSIKTWIEMASVLPQEAIDQSAFFQKNNITYLDAPVSGGTVAANNRNLAIMVGGEDDVYKEAIKIFEPLGKSVLVGPCGAGQLAKLANQAIVGITIGAVAEAVLLLERGGVNVDSVREALSGGFADSAILQQHGKRMSDRNFEAGGSIKTQLKDMQNIQYTAQMFGVELPIVDKVTDRYLSLSDDPSNLEKDHSALFLELLKRNSLID